jgi:hypothetical protein
MRTFCKPFCTFTSYKQGTSETWNLTSETPDRTGLGDIGTTRFISIALAQSTAGSHTPRIQLSIPVDSTGMVSSYRYGGYGRCTVLCVGSWVEGFILI